MKCNSLTFDRIKKSPYKKPKSGNYFYVHKQNGITDKYDFKDQLVETIDQRRKNIDWNKVNQNLNRLNTKKPWFYKILS